MHVDLGCGDGRAAYRWAQKHPAHLFVAVDANADALREIAWRASRKPSRGGVDNLICIAATPEELAAEVGSCAHAVTVLLPWGSLLVGLAKPEPSMLEAVRALCHAGASLEVVMSYDPRDAALALQELNASHLGDAFRAAYRAAGFRVDEVEALDPKALRAYPSTWAKKLAMGRAREVWRVRGRAQLPEPGLDGT